MNKDETIFIHNKHIDDDDIDDDIDTSIKLAALEPENKVYHITFESDTLARMFVLYAVPVLENVALYRMDAEVYIVDPKVPQRVTIIEELANKSGAKVFRRIQ